MSKDLIIGLIVGAAIGLTIGVLWTNKVETLWYKFIDSLPSLEDLFAEDGIVFKYRKVLIAVLAVAVLATSVYGYIHFTRKTPVVAVGQSYTLLDMDVDGCRNEFNITLTQTHVDQGFVVVGKGDCERKYTISAPKPAAP